MPDIETAIEPPIFGTEDEGSKPTIGISASIFEADGTHRCGSVHLADDTPDDEIATQLVASIRAVATLRSPTLEAAVARLLADSP